MATLEETLKKLNKGKALEDQVKKVSELQEYITESINYKIYDKYE